MNRNPLIDNNDAIRARLKCVETGYPVHIGCGGEATPTTPVVVRYVCHKCGVIIGSELVAEPPVERNYRSDVASLLAQLDAKS